MATNGITIDAKTSAGTMEALAAAIDARSKAIGSTTQDSMVAAAITILRSLKSATKKAPAKRVPKGAYTITKTNLIGCPTKKWGGKIGCHVKGDKTISPIRPAVGYEPGAIPPWKASVYCVTPTNQNLKFAKGKNAPARCWYVLCADEGQARNWADRRFVGKGGKDKFRGILPKESGMANAALAMAQAKASTKSRVVTKEDFAAKGTMSQRASSLAYGAGELKVSSSGMGSGEVGVSFFDALRYSAAASGGDSSLQSAIAKAVNSLFGAYGSPEIKKELEDLKKSNPEAKFIDVLKRHFA